MWTPLWKSNNFKNEMVFKYVLLKEYHTNDIFKRFCTVDFEDNF